MRTCRAVSDNNLYVVVHVQPAELPVHRTIHSSLTGVLCQYLVVGVLQEMFLEYRWYQDLDEAIDLCSVHDKSVFSNWVFGFLFSHLSGSLLTEKYVAWCLRNSFILYALPTFSEDLSWLQRHGRRPDSVHAGVALHLRFSESCRSLRLVSRLQLELCPLRWLACATTHRPLDA